MNEVETKLAAAKTRLILDKPFLGALVLRLPLKAATWCRTTATDARTLYYNPRWIEGLSAGEVQFALAHEALHCALGHFARRGHRIQRKWDLACDFAVNPILVDEGLTPPAEALVLDVYRGMAAEEIYPCIDDSNDDSRMMDEHVWDGAEGGDGGGQGKQNEAQGKGKSRAEKIDAHAGGSNQQKVGAGETAGDGENDPPPPLSAREKEQLKEQWQRHLAVAAQRAREAGKLSGQLARLADAALAAQVSWRALLAQYLSQIARDDYTWQRPSRREGEVIWPSLRSHGGDLHVALDISGSVTEKDLADFLGELNALKGALPVRITLHACDSALAEGGPWFFEPWDELRLPRQFSGGGGTVFTPVFEWIERAGAQPDALIYFTDADGEFPRQAPNYPVLWLVKGKAPVPFGRRIQLN
ncbi:vWA domain-containing protein [Sulfuricystis multivorans]|uniref:vWA domain-containing protein n=1 Tax=Sulfuricystis multivorans TaxID=2211108 RepID=UPI000F83E537|nr:VWA-like domain-containing protein [Sulfuricystis multivorans]